MEVMLIIMFIHTRTVFARCASESLWVAVKVIHSYG